jgi:hypothetical protein
VPILLTFTLRGTATFTPLTGEAKITTMYILINNCYFSEGYFFNGAQQQNFFLWMCGKLDRSAVLCGNFDGYVAGSVINVSHKHRVQNKGG